MKIEQLLKNVERNVKAYDHLTLSLQNDIPLRPSLRKNNNNTPKEKLNIANNYYNIKKTYQ